MAERETILGLLRLGWSARRIERETGHRRETVARYGREAGLLLPPSRAEPPAPAGASKPASDGEVATDLAAASVSANTSGASIATRSACEPHRDFIEAAVAAGRNAVAIYQDLVEHHGYDGAYNAVKRFVRKLRPHESKVSCRFETAPGQEGQVDYGEGALTRDPRTGKYRRPRLFVMSLGASRHAFRATVWNSSTQTWCDLHEAAFAYFGGTPKTMRLDNLLEGIIKPDVYDPEVNALYAAMLSHYGVVALPCRPYAPDLKGKVESAVGYTQMTALKGRRFESIEEQNAFLMRWNERWAATRIHGTTKRQVREMFEEERAALQPLPPTRFEHYRILERRAHFDGHVEVNGTYYSVPARYAGLRVVVHAGQLWLRILDPASQQCVREHTIAQRGTRRTVDEDRPKQTPAHIDTLVVRATKLGTACGAFARAVASENRLNADRTLFGLFDLVRRYDQEVVERACYFAVESGVFRLRLLRAYLAQHAVAAKLNNDHQIVPQVNTYATHFATLVQGESPA